MLKDAAASCARGRPLVRAPRLITVCVWMCGACRGGARRVQVRCWPRRLRTRTFKSGKQAAGRRVHGATPRRSQDTPAPSSPSHVMPVSARRARRAREPPRGAWVARAMPHGTRTASSAHGLTRPWAHARHAGTGHGLLASGSYDRTIRLWQVASPVAAPTSDADGAASLLRGCLPCPLPPCPPCRAPRAWPQVRLAP